MRSHLAATATLLGVLASCGDGGGVPGDGIGDLPDGSAPRVVTSVPGANAVDVVTDIVVELTFSAPMDPASTESAFSLSSGGAPVGGTFAWSANDTVLRFTPSVDLATRTPHTLRVIAVALTRDGLSSLIDDFEASFTTGDGPRGTPSSQWDELVWDVDVWE